LLAMLAHCIGSDPWRFYSCRHFHFNLLQASVDPAS
jgi:hypothetical protein